jgi:hypothetical protein
MKKFALCIAGIFSFFNVEFVSAQCCAGGSGSPVVGGTSQGVLSLGQMEFSTNLQFVKTDRFFSGDSEDSAGTFDSFESTYQYMRLAYGVSRNFTFSVESGYYFNKKETGLDNNPSATYQSKGIGDLIIFPRYDIINKSNEKYRTEVTLGLGFKIPLGSYNDSTGNLEPFSGQTFYVTKPTAVQLSSGSQDLIFYTFLYRGFLKNNFRLFANAFFIRKGYNPNSEKMGDFASFGIFAGKTVLKNWGITLQSRYEWMDRMEINENILLFGKPSNYFPEATGYKKLFFTPQLSYTKGIFTMFGAIDIPVYQYMNSSEFYTQAGSQHQTTVGVALKFYPVKSLVPDENCALIYQCPMHPEEVDTKPGACIKCGMDLEKVKQ